ncbi:hypothetical protein Sm713_44340 [Streptomyces sp. TS71-3]|nr:hypothetical protein Sm713_44340 [Streptomyces sp. TS71-3]
MITGPEVGMFSAPSTRGRNIRRISGPSTALRNAKRDNGPSVVKGSTAAPGALVRRSPQVSTVLVTRGRLHIDHESGTGRHAMARVSR